MSYLRAKRNMTMYKLRVFAIFLYFTFIAACVYHFINHKVASMNIKDIDKEITESINWVLKFPEVITE